MRQVMADAADTHRFTSPFSNVKPLKVRKVDIQPFTLEEVDRILKTVRMDWRDYLQVRFLTGMRTGEVNGLKWKYVDFERRLILIRETFVLGEDEYTKTDSSQRDIQMSQVVFEALRAQQAATGKLSDYVFCNKEGKPLDNDNFGSRVWYPLLRHLGLKKRWAYQMRHTAATLWLASGEAPEWIARQLGHSSTEMLFRVYSRYVPNLSRQDGSAIDRLLATRFATTNAVPATAPAPAPAPASGRSPSASATATAPTTTEAQP
jgi:integrase